MRVQSLAGEYPLEEGMATHQYSCLESPMDTGAWETTVHRVTQSQTTLKRLGTCRNGRPGRREEGVMSL